MFYVPVTSFRDGWQWRSRKTTKAADGYCQNSPSDKMESNKNKTRDEPFIQRSLYTSIR